MDECVSMDGTRVWDIGTDIGGTFTDIIAVHADGADTRIAKVPSRPDAPVTAMMEALAAVGLGPMMSAASSMARRG